MKIQLLVALLVLALFLGCSNTAVLEKRIAENEKRLENLGIDVSDNTMKINNIEPSEAGTVRNAEPEPDNGQLKQRIERLERDIVDLKRELRSIQSREADTFTRFAQPEAVEDKKAEPKIERTVEPAPSQVEIQYQAARELYLKRKYDAAILSFQELISRYPTNDLAANAQYWIGECFYDRDSFVKAIDEFQKVIDFYPTSKKAPDAQLKVGLCYQQLGKVEQARLEIQRIGKMYPNYERKELIEKILKDMQ